MNQISSIRPAAVLAIRTGVAAILLILGLALLSLNLYGFTQPLRKPALGEKPEDLRFVPEEVWSYEKSMLKFDSLSETDPRHIIARTANSLANGSLVHVDWNEVNPIEYRQLIPVWENYLLHLLGRLSNDPQHQRYHFASYRRTLERGIGLCGDASTLLSSILHAHGVPNQIVSFPGHVIVEYELDDGTRELLDPDFGVALGLSLADLTTNPSAAISKYLEHGYTRSEAYVLAAVYGRRYATFESTYAFMPKRYLFEHVSYVLIWALPLLLIMIAAGVVLKARSRWQFALRSTATSLH